MQHLYKLFITLLCVDKRGTSPAQIEREVRAIEAWLDYKAS